TEIMPMNAVRVSTFMMLSMSAKLLFNSVPAMHSSTRPTMGPSACRRPRHEGTVCRPARPPACAAGTSGRLLCSGCMSNQLLLVQLFRLEHSLQMSRAHHRHAVAQADKLHELR